MSGTKPLLTARPAPSSLLGTADAAFDERRCRISRFAYLHREANELLLESPLSRTQMVVHDARVLTLLFEGIFRRDEPVACEVLNVLRETGFLAEIDETGTTEEDRVTNLRAWEFHDLLFHARSRAGRHRVPYGATFRMEGVLAPPAPMKPRMPGRIVRLPRASIPSLRRTDARLTAVIEDRRTRREHDSVPITIDEIGRFLFRCARACEVVKRGKLETTRRVYPGGGAAYELEVYLVVNRCRGLAKGLYHYRPLDHCLSKLKAPEREVNELIEAAARTQHSAPPQILIILTARVQRLFWKYSSMAYAIVLKDVGVLYQTMYLVAESMRLAACALGGGNADLFARASGVDYYQEPSVGEFTLGRRQSTQAERLEQSDTVR